MSASTRKFIGMLILLVGMTVYIGLVVTIATVWLPTHWAVQLVYYVVAGVAWAFPLRPFMAWINQPDPEN